MILAVVFLGVALAIAIANTFILKQEVDILKQKTKEKISDVIYFKKVYTIYYDKYLKLTEPEVIH